MSSMVAEPGPIPSEKRQPVLYKEQIIERIDENSEIQTTLETYESMIILKQNLDIPVSEMMEQLVEATETISQHRIQQCTLEQISDSNVLSRDRPQRLFDVIVGTNQDSTDETRNTGKEKGGNQTMTERMSIDKGELLVERECDVSVLIKQICTESDVMSQCVLCLSGLAAYVGMLHWTEWNIAECYWYVPWERDVWQRSPKIASQRDCWYLETVDG